MDIDKELEALMNDPLLNMTEQERALFDIPEDMKKVIEKRAKADYVAQRKPCPDFYLYQPIFEKAHQELREGIRNLAKLSKTETIEAGQYFIIDGRCYFWNILIATFNGEKK